MNNQFTKVRYIDTELYLVKKDSPLQNVTLIFLHSVWGTLKSGNEFPPIFPGPQPISIERKHFELLKKNTYAVCEKTDGIRHVCMCFMFGDKKMCVLVNRALDVYLLPLNMPRKSYEYGTTVDGELVKNTVDGKWYFISNESYAKKKIYFVDNEAYADLKIYFVTNEAYAGWKNRSKMHLME